MFFFLVEIFHRTIGGDTESIPFLEAFVFAVVVAIVFQPLKNWINESFNRYLYRHTTTTNRFYVRASRTLSIDAGAQTP